MQFPEVPVNGNAIANQKGHFKYKKIIKIRTNLLAQRFNKDKDQQEQFSYPSQRESQFNDKKGHYRTLSIKKTK